MSFKGSEGDKRLDEFCARFGVTRATNGLFGFYTNDGEPCLYRHTRATLMNKALLSTGERVGYARWSWTGAKGVGVLGDARNRAQYKRILFHGEPSPKTPAGVGEVFILIPKARYVDHAAEFSNRKFSTVLNIAAEPSREVEASRALFYDKQYNMSEDELRKRLHGSNPDTPFTPDLTPEPVSTHNPPVKKRKEKPDYAAFGSKGGRAFARKHATDPALAKRLGGFASRKFKPCNGYGGKGRPRHVWNPADGRCWFCKKNRAQLLLRHKK